MCPSYINPKQVADDTVQHMILQLYRTGKALVEAHHYDLWIRGRFALSTRRTVDHELPLGALHHANAPRRSGAVDHRSLRSPTV